MKISLRILPAALLLCCILCMPSPVTARSEDAFIVSDDPYCLPLDLDFENYKPDPDCFTKNSYHDDSLDITLESQKYRGIEFYIARIRVQSPTQLRTAIAGKPNEDVTVMPSRMAKKLNAVLTINSENYTHRKERSYVYRQGIAMRNDAHPDLDVLIIDSEGDFHIFTSKTKKEEIAAFIESGGTPVNAFSFGPALVSDGQRCKLNKNYEHYPNKNTWRTIIAQDGPLSYLFIISTGGTHAEIADFCYNLGVTAAYNLDGGYSSTMLFGEKYIGGRSKGRERAQSDIIYVVTAVQQSD